MWLKVHVRVLIHQKSHDIEVTLKQNFIIILKYMYTVHYA